MITLTPFAVKSLKKNPLLLESFNKIPSVPSVEIEKIVSILFIKPSLKIFIKKSGAKNIPTELANVARGDFVETRYENHHPKNKRVNQQTGIE